MTASPADSPLFLSPPLSLSALSSHPGGLSRQQRLETIARLLLQEIDPDPTREGLEDTPRRWAKMWREFTEYDPGVLDTAFESISHGQMVTVSGMRVWSMCEHHLLPFWCDISVGYIAENKVLGLSKFARIAHKYAHSLQVQERLVEQIATEMQEALGTADVAVIARGEHLCMSMRGIRTPALMTSSAMKGGFKDPTTRQEFLTLALPR